MIVWCGNFFVERYTSKRKLPSLTIILEGTTAIPWIVILKKWTGHQDLFGHNIVHSYNSYVETVSLAIDIYVPRISKINKAKLSW